MRPERCNEPTCSAEVARSDGARCGGVLFGIRDEAGGGSVGCGYFFCDVHLVGRRGPFYCQPCWRAQVARRAAVELFRASDARQTLRGEVTPVWVDVPGAAITYPPTGCGFCGLPAGSADCQRSHP